MMKALFDPLFILYATIWVTVHLFRYNGTPLPWVNGWLTDFIFIPVVAHISLTFTKQMVLRSDTYKYPLRHLLLSWIYVSVVCEGLLPIISDRAVRDYFDVLAYLGGSLFFYYIHQHITFTPRLQMKTALLH